MDSTDERLLEILKEDGRAPYTSIADELGVSEGTVRNRIEALQEEGIIERFTIDVADEAKGIAAFVLVTLSTDVAIEDSIASFPSDMKAYEVTGEYDMVIQLSRESSEALNEAIDAIREVDGVEGTKTYSVLNRRSR